MTAKRRERKKMKNELVERLWAELYKNPDEPRFEYLKFLVIMLETMPIDNYCLEKLAKCEHPLFSVDARIDDEDLYDEYKRRIEESIFRIP